MGYVGAQYAVDFTIHLEDDSDRVRIGAKQLVNSVGGTYDGGTEIHYYGYDVYCGRNVLVGRILQMAVTQDMPASEPEITRAGGLFSMLTLILHSGLAVEYRGHSIPVEQAQNMRIGDLVTHPVDSNKVRLLGTMDVTVCLPCCCTIPKLLFPSMIPSKQYDIFDGNHDFCSPSAPVEPSKYKQCAIIQEFSSPESSSMERGEVWQHRQNAQSGPKDDRTKEEMLAALKRLKDDGILDFSEYVSKVNLVNSQYSALQKERDDLAALKELLEQGILSTTEYERKCETLRSLGKSQ